MVVAVRVPSFGEKAPFKNYLYFIEPRVKERKKILGNTCFKNVNLKAISLFKL